MKRIYACLCIVAVLLGVAFYSSWRVQKFAEDISDDIDDAMEAIRDEDLPSARQALAEGAELCDKMREGSESPAPHAGLHRTGSCPSRRGRTSRTERPRRKHLVNCAGRRFRWRRWNGCHVDLCN